MNVFKISVAETGMFKHYPLKAQNELDAIKEAVEFVNKSDKSFSYITLEKIKPWNKVCSIHIKKGNRSEYIGYEVQFN